MTAETSAGLIAKRIALVEELTALNARQLLHSQTRGGIEFELLACAEDIERNGETAARVAQRTELENRLSRIADRVEDCDRQLDELTGRLNELDRELAKT
ncbi:MAG: hypothetical protein ACR2PM_17045 [Hyphomicrobiales bacterium]